MSQVHVVVPYGRSRNDHNIMARDYHPGRHRVAINEYLLAANAAGWFAVFTHELEGGTQLFMERRSGDAECPVP